MSKPKVVFFCSECGNESSRWLGRCPDCGSYNSLVEQQVSAKPASGLASPGRVSTVVKIGDISEEAAFRQPLDIGEFDRVLGGGLVAGSVVLLAGDPGIGKSTLLLQAAQAIAAAHKEVLYISAEESVHQVQERAKRMGNLQASFLLASETDLDAIEAHITAIQPALAIIDSIQAISDTGLEAAPGSISQVRQCAGRLIRLAKARNLPIFLVGHVTKEGVIAGPRLLEHMVDTVLYLEGERHLGYRLLRGQKNRFGSTDEVGIFEMTEAGLKEVKDPSGLFLSQYSPGSCGNALTVVIEGSRPLIIETQGLVSPAGGPPRRASAGFDYNRLCLISAVLEKQVRLPLSVNDIFVNIPGGLQISEPAADLAVALSLISSQRDRALPQGMVFIGEVGLTGEVRAVSRLERRLTEAARLGLKSAMVPAGALAQDALKGMQFIPVANLKQAAAQALGKN